MRCLYILYDICIYYVQLTLVYLLYKLTVLRDNTVIRFKAVCKNTWLLLKYNNKLKKSDKENENMNIRRAEEKDIDKVTLLLNQVLELHAKLRPDIFKTGTAKYTKEELKNIFKNDETPVFVAVDKNDDISGYAFCVLKNQPFTTVMKEFITLYIDDICIDEKCRGKHVGTSLYKYVLEYARKQGCYDVTLNVWEGNDNARAFYEKMGMFVKETQMEIII